eukprot:2902462-Pleurochrysis_carterae.AAC.1
MELSKMHRKVDESERKNLMLKKEARRGTKSNPVEVSEKANGAADGSSLSQRQVPPPASRNRDWSRSQ